MTRHEWVTVEEIYIRRIAFRLFSKVVDIKHQKTHNSIC